MLCYLNLECGVFLSFTEKIYSWDKRDHIFSKEPNLQKFYISPFGSWVLDTEYTILIKTHLHARWLWPFVHNTSHWGASVQREMWCDPHANLQSLTCIPLVKCMRPRNLLQLYWGMLLNSAVFPNSFFFTLLQQGNCWISLQSLTLSSV